jgi:hypothetical protein
MKSRFPALLKVGLITLFVIAAISAAYVAYAKSYDFFVKFNVKQA